MHRDPRDVELEALRTQLSSVLARLDATLAQNAAVLAQNADLAAQVAKLNERIAKLLPVAKRKARKPKPTSRSDAVPSALTDERRRAFENRPRPPIKPEKDRALGRRTAKPTGRSAVPQHLSPGELPEVRAPRAARPHPSRARNAR